MRKSSSLSVASFFAGAGGLDLGFKQAGFVVPWANEYDKTIWETYEANHPETFLDQRSIVDINGSDIPKVNGFIGGPPCQSWSEAGSLRGIGDHRGQLFFEYLRLIEAKKPDFFLAENVSGILFSRHSSAFTSILKGFTDLGYNVSFGLLSSNDYGVAQVRERVIIVGYKTAIGKFFSPPVAEEYKPVFKDIIWDLKGSAKPALEGNKANTNLKVPNHEYMTGGFSSMFMSRNRVRTWDEPSFTIQAGGRHAPLHPQAPKMVHVGKDQYEFAKGKEDLYRRLSVREAARVQAFPDDFIFHYKNVTDGYKMIGNAVAVTFAQHLAAQIALDLSDVDLTATSRKKGEIVPFEDLPVSSLQLSNVG
jgi:DNA (cytosine-5)-methyltransferase 1